MTKREREPAEIGAMSRRVFRALVRRAGDGDVEALRELVALQAQLATAITDAGRGLHDFGFSFTYLAAETGVTRQAARKRYGRHMWEGGPVLDATPESERWNGTSDHGYDPVVGSGS